MSELNYASALAALDGEFESASAQTGGSTNNTWRHSDMTSDSTPHSNAWNTPWNAMHSPANKKPNETMRMQSTHMAWVVADSENSPANGWANNSTPTQPSSISPAV